MKSSCLFARRSACFLAWNSRHQPVRRLISQVLAGTALWIMNTPTAQAQVVFGPGSTQYFGPGNQIGGYDVTYVVPTGAAAMYGKGSTIFATNDFTVQGGGSLLIELDIQVGGNFITEISRLTLGGNVNVAGSASLSGVLGFANNQAPQPNARYIILTAGKGIIGRFSRLDTLYPVQPGSLLAYAIRYQGNAVIVETVPNYQIIPEELGAIYSIGSARMNGVVNSLQNRFAEIRSSRENAFTGAEVKPPSSTSAKSALDAPVLTPASKQRHGVFTTASGDFSRIGNTANANGYDTETGTILAGYDSRIDDSLTVGVLVGYSHSNSDLHGNGGIDTDGCNAALYAQYVRNDWFLESMIGGGYYSYDTDREALNGTASGDTNGGSFDGYLSIGKDLRSGSLTVTPFASLLYVRTGIDEYDETGSSQPLRIESQAADSLCSRLGLRASKAFVKDAFLITPYASAEWQYELLDDAPTVDYSFANGAGGIATATGPEIGRHSLLASAGLQVAWDRYACYLSYQADLGRENYENQTVLTGFRIIW
jgi:outer membrane autotransporter protein